MQHITSLASPHRAAPKLGGHPEHLADVPLTLTLYFSPLQLLQLQMPQGGCG